MMIDQNRLRLMLFHAFALYLATSFVQLHARPGSWLSADTLSVDSVSSFVWRRMADVGRIEQDQNYLFMPAN